MRSRSERPRRQVEVPDISVESLRYHVGDVIADKYRLEELMGQGAMGVVWRARNLALDVDVAVKVIHGELVNEETTERLRREAHAAARLEHPSAVRVFDLGESELGDPFLVMELLKGESLYDVLDRRKTIPPEEAVAILLPVIGALSVAHNKNIVHRDLKPDNIVLVPQEEGVLPKIVDFGIAIVDNPRFERRSTTAGTVLGSPDYMSPEQARGEIDGIDARTDIWSVGVVLYEMIAGRPPFLAPNALAQLRAICETEPESLESLGAADARLSAIVTKALTKNVAERYQDMKTFGQKLAEWALSVGTEMDVTGTGIAAVWLRGSRGSLASAGSLRPEPLRSSSSTLPRVLTPSVAVWTPVKPPPNHRRLALAIGAGVLVVTAAIAIVALQTSKPKANEGTSVASTAAEPAQTSSASPATPRPSATPSARSEPAAPAAATSSASSSVQASAAPIAATQDAGACIVSLFAEDAFEPDAALVGLCSENDPRRGAATLRAEIARHGLVHRKTTTAMRSWAALSWYELPAFAVVRAACCTGRKLGTLDVPQTVGTCPPLAPILETLASDVQSGGDTEKTLASFKEVVACTERAHRLNSTLVRVYTYKDPPQGSAESAFRALLERATKTPAR